MPDIKLTRCPGCATVFRITPAQLALREGQVRCGHCRAVFDANEHLFGVGIPPRVGDGAPDELAQGRPTVTLHSADALQPAPVPDEPSVPHSIAVGDTDSAATDSATVAAGAVPPAAWGRPPRAAHPRKALYACAIPFLLIGLAAQGVLHLHDTIAAHVPAMRPLFERACSVLGCVIHPLRDASSLSIEASDLQADPAHRGLLILTATVRNRASFALSYPDVELTLTDSADQVVVRRAFAPSEYAGLAADVARGIAANGEMLVKLFIDASATTQAGYRLYLFYP